MFRITNISNKPIFFQKVLLTPGMSSDFISIYDFTQLTQLVNARKIMYFEVSIKKAVETSNIPEVKETVTEQEKTVEVKTEIEEKPVFDYVAETPAFVIDNIKEDSADNTTSEDAVQEDEKPRRKRRK